MRILLIAFIGLVLSTGCVSQRTLDGKSQPAQQFNTQEAAHTRLALGLQYLRAGNYEQAKSNLERALSYTPNNPDVFTGLAYYYQQVRDFKSAETFYRKAIQQRPNDGDSYNNLGVLLCSQQRYDEADAMFRKAINQSGYVKIASTYQNAGRCASHHQNFEKADEYYQLALNHSGGSVNILESYATLLVEQERFEQAATYIAQRAEYPQLSAQYLWLEVQLAHANNNRIKRDEFGTLLLSRFPDTQQARDYVQLRKN